jgi:hypothetical protein
MKSLVDHASRLYGEHNHFFCNSIDLHAGDMNRPSGLLHFLTQHTQLQQKHNTLNSNTNTTHSTPTETQVFLQGKNNR